MTSDQAALGGSYRAIRAVRARDDGPWPGVLVRAATGESLVLVDADVLGAEWGGWDAAPDGHLLAPLDIARRADGHAVVLPVCAERLEDFVRRRAARMPLSAGEAVTLGVSVLRACAEIASVPDTTGEWWLDDAGRPLLATDAAPGRALDTAATVLEQVAVDAHAQRTWSTALRAIGAERISVHELAAAEEALFTIATAEPLSTVTLSPRGAAEGAVRTLDRAHDGAAAAVYDPPPRSMWQSLIVGVDDDLADTVSRATTAVWRRLRRTDGSTRPASRRAPWLVGGTVAAAVLTGGALWPSASGVATEEPEKAVSTPAASPTASASNDGEGAESEAEPGTTDAAPRADLATVTSALLEARTACAGSVDCLAAVTVDPATRFAGAVELAATERTVTLLDDFGDIAVLRVDANDPGLPPQLVVILRTDEKWLLRDVTDVAQQP